MAVKTPPRMARQSFSAVAYRVGVVTRDDLHRAVRLSKGGRKSLDAVLERHFISPTLARRVKIALARAKHTCPRCGGLDRLACASRDFPCHCHMPHPPRKRRKRRW